MQDPFGGFVHENPEFGYAEPEPYGEAEPYGEPAYDGYGNPVGLFRFLRKFRPRLPLPFNPFQAANLARRFVAPALQNVVRRVAAPALQSFARSVIPGLGMFAPGPMRRLPFPQSGHRLPFPLPVRRLPAGWIRPSSPYAARAPRRLYLRCSAWPGPRGLVPLRPGAPSGPAMPGMPGMPGMPSAPGAPGAGRRRGRRRRR